MCHSRILIVRSFYENDFNTIHRVVCVLIGQLDAQLQLIQNDIQFTASNDAE